MEKKELKLSIDVYNDLSELSPADAQLVTEARKATQFAYAPYSRFRVAAVARLANGKIISGTNQENASFPAGICAERVLLSSIASQFPGIAVEAIAISYKNENGESKHPISPCGICRQSLQEYEQRMKHPIRLILGGQEGKTYIIHEAASLLPLAFTGDELL
ncbi:MAG: cytidine deaminase [Bacteroidetes bacterium]|nr:cytidine deaminase [Bacteroidota bacterium]